MTTELVNLTTGEVVSYADAHDSVSRARDHVNGFWAEVKWQADNRVWQILGYDDFNALWATEYEGLGVSISRAERPELVASMRAIGQTQQQIADKLGVDHRTVGRDLNGQMPNEDQPAPPITNSRGQQRPASYTPRPEPKPEPEPVDEPEIVDAEIIPDIPRSPATPSAARLQQAEIERGWRDTCTAIAECVRSLDGGEGYGRVFLTEFYPHEHEYLHPQQRLTRQRIDKAIAFLRTIREGI